MVDNQPAVALPTDADVTSSPATPTLPTMSDVAALYPRPQHALPDTTVHEIRFQAIVLGQKHEVVAQALGVSRSVVSLISTGRRRAALPPDARLTAWLSDRRS